VGRPEPGEGLGGGSGRPTEPPADQAAPSTGEETTPLMDYLFGKDAK
jgi:hypothetical protein